MKVTIQSVRFDADRRLTEFVEQKLAKLDRFVERVTSADVTLRLDRDHELGNKVAAIRLAVPGEELLAEARSKSFEEAVDMAIDAIKKQIDRYKEKLK
jgi:putative sigma-54 modulation protein